MPASSPLQNETRIAFAFDLALRHGSIRPVFQPIVHLNGGAVSSFEVLARWTDETLGIIPPAVFIPIVEKRGLIAPLTSHLIREACSAAREWPGLFRLAFNISPLHFQDGEMPSLLEDAVRDARFPLARTQIEITETAVIGDLAAARATIDLLRAKGVRILLDDFGTGYSSLSRLQALPFDKIKIDASFVGSMEQSRDSRKIVSAVIGLGQNLGVPVVAEGVETVAQATMLTRLGCSFGQGWLFGRPVSMEKIPAILHERGTAPYDPPPRGLSISQRLAQLDALYAAPLGLCFVSHDLRILSANPHFAALVGQVTGTLVGLTIPDIDADVASDLRTNLELARRGETIVPRIWTLRPSGRRGLLIVTPARDEIGDLLGLSLIVTDLPA